LFQTIIQNFTFIKKEKTMKQTTILIILLTMVHISYAEEGFHPADTNQDWQITAQEFQAYNQAWQQNQSWPQGTVPIPLTDLTRAAYLLSNGGNYFYDDSKTDALRWVSGTKPITNTLGMTFVYIAPGTFMMGSPSDEPGRYGNEIQHEVQLTEGFCMQTTEVTNQQFVDFLNAVNRRGPSGQPWFETESEDSDSHIQGSTGNFNVENGYQDHPAIEVSWYGATAMAEWLTEKEGRFYHLPTEAQWEYAARAGTTTPFAFGNCLSTDAANYNGNYPLTGCAKGTYRAATVAVGTLQSNAWKLYDMHGNVYEWCRDWYGTYSSTAVVDPVGPTGGSDRVIRGGYWGNGAGRCRSASRRNDGPGYTGGNLGFRLVFRLPPGR
jgi:formylglycine-generating enzyme required for sulfatase activity